MTNHHRIVAGGAIATLGDSSVAIALLTLVRPSERIITIEFKINFFIPTLGGGLIAKAKIIHKKSKTVVGVAEIINEDGKLVAEVIATYGIERVD